MIEHKTRCQVIVDEAEAVRSRNDSIQKKTDWRCVVCTLPAGNCKHDAQWFCRRAEAQELEFAQQIHKTNQDAVTNFVQYRTRPVPETNPQVSTFLKDVNEVLNDLPFVGNKTKYNQEYTPFLDHQYAAKECPKPHWQVNLETIDASCVPGLDKPVARGGHTLTAVDDERLVLFGGATCATTPSRPTTFMPYTTALASNASRPGPGMHRMICFGPEIHILTQYKGKIIWRQHNPKVHANEKPMPRYGHAAVAVGSCTLFIFGGRASNGTFLHDAWFLTLQSLHSEILPTTDNDEASTYCTERTMTTGASIAEKSSYCSVLGGSVPLPGWHRLPSGPSARSGAALAFHSLSNSVVLFGGRGASHCCDDMWLYSLPNQAWTQPVVAGTPPRARFGHVLIQATPDQVLVFGGCGLSATQEHGRSVPSDNVDNAAYEVAHCYAAEKLNVLLAADAVEQELACNYKGSQRSRAKDQSQAMAQLAASVARREAETALAQAEFLEQAQMAKASDYMASIVNRDVDTVILDIAALVWSRTIETRGMEPSPRVGLGACALDTGDHDDQSRSRFVILGGAEPTPSSIRQAQKEPHDKLVAYLADIRFKERQEIYWSQPVEYESISVREARRRQLTKEAKHRTIQARDAARSLGIIRSERNLRVVAADVALVTASDNAKRAAIDDVIQILPRARVGAAVSRLGPGRVVIHGGWLFEDDGLLATAELSVLGLETTEERTNRLQREQAEFLEQWRQERDTEDTRLAKSAVYAARIFLLRTAADQAVERSLMAVEHVRSIVPPLTTAPQVRLVKASNKCIWLKWKRVSTDARGELCDNVIHLLYMRGGFRPLVPGNRVLSTWENTSSNDSAEYDDTTTSSTRRHPATVLRDHGDGTFDLAFDDGTAQKNVQRKRIIQAESSKWQLIYAGPDSQYAVQSLIPDFILANEPGITVTCDFKLETRNTEFSWDSTSNNVVKSQEPSISSSVSTFGTISVPFTLGFPEDEASTLSIHSKGARRKACTAARNRLQQHLQNDSKFSSSSSEGPSKLKRRLRAALCADLDGQLLSIGLRGTEFTARGRGLHYI